MESLFIVLIFLIPSIIIGIIKFVKNLREHRKYLKILDEMTGKIRDVNIDKYALSLSNLQSEYEEASAVIMDKYNLNLHDQLNVSVSNYVPFRSSRRRRRKRNSTKYYR